MADRSSTEVNTRSHMTRYLLHYVDNLVPPTTTSCSMRSDRSVGVVVGATAVVSYSTATKQRMVVIEAGLDLMMHVYRAP